MAKTEQIATIETDLHGAYIVWGGEGSVYRPRPSATSHDLVYVFSQPRAVVSFTTRETGDKRHVMQAKDVRGNKYLLVYDKDLRELWAWHGINTNTAEKTYTPWHGVRTLAVPEPRPPTGAWHRSHLLAAQLYGKVI